MMGKRTRHKRRRVDESVLRDVGRIFVSVGDGQEVELVGREADELRELMSSQCPICRAGGSH